VEAYYDEDWLASVQFVEQSIPEYFKEYRRCLAFCDYVYDQQTFAQLHEQIINSNVASRDKLLLGTVFINIAYTLLVKSLQHC